MNISYSPPLTDYQQLLQAFIESIEGQSPAPYLDSIGVPTIGWGFAIGGKPAVQVGVNYLLYTVLGMTSPANLGSLDPNDSLKEQQFEKELVDALNQYWPSNPKGDGVINLGLQNALNAILRERSTAIKATYSSIDRLLIGNPFTKFAMTAPQMAAYFKVIQSTFNNRLAGSVGTAILGNSSEEIALFRSGAPDLTPSMQ